MNMDSIVCVQFCICVCVLRSGGVCDVRGVGGSVYGERGRGAWV